MKLFHVNDDTWNRCKMTVKQAVNHFHRKNPIYTHAKYNKIQYSIMRHNKKCHVTKQKITRKNINKSINKLKMAFKCLWLSNFYFSSGHLFNQTILSMCANIR